MYCRSYYYGLDKYHPISVLRTLWGNRLVLSLQGEALGLGALLVPRKMLPSPSGLSVGVEIVLLSLGLRYLGYLVKPLFQVCNK